MRRDGVCVENCNINSPISVETFRVARGCKRNPCSVFLERVLYAGSFLKSSRKKELCKETKQVLSSNRGFLETSELLHII